MLITTRPFNIDKSWGIKERKDYALDENGNRIPHIYPETGLQKLDGRNRKQWKRVYVQANNWNDQTKAEEWRAAWEDAANAALEKHGHESRIDHRSYERQRASGKIAAEQIPTVHMGVAATQMERKGIATERGNMNREISRLNQIIFAIIEKLKQLKDKLKEALTPAAPTPPTTTPPTLASILQSFLEDSDLHNRFGQIRDVRAAERVLAFMQKNGISKMSELREKVYEIYDKSGSMDDKLKAGKIRSDAEQLVRDLNRPQQQQRSTKDRGSAR
ncbi:MAG: MobA/MobL family protein [Eubacteriales bacterium]|nr:MobA/MobL family protein [Eubacteriales bacterium]